MKGYRIAFQYIPCSACNRNVSFTDSQTEQTCGCQGGKGGGGSRMNREFGISRCRLLHLQWINNKVLLHSTGNCIQSPGTDHDEK